MKLHGFLLLATAALTGCGEVPPPSSPAPAPVSTAAMRSTCPLGVDNAHVAFDDTAKGAELVFDTTPDRVVELRARVHHAAELHGNGKHAGAGHAGKHGLGAGKHGLRPSSLPKAHATDTETPNGARLVFVPDDDKDLETLRTKLKERAAKMMMRCD